MLKHPSIQIALVFTLLFVFVKNSYAKTSENVARAIFTTQVENREPVNTLNNKTVEADTNKVYFFTEIINKANSKIIHRWYLNGRLEAEVMLNIGSDRWRTYSSKNLMKNFHAGNWQVEVLDEQGKLLASEIFSYALD